MTRPNDRISRSIHPRLDTDRYVSESSYRDDVHRLLDEVAPGGFALFGGSVDDVLWTTGQLRASGGQRLVFSADCEFGLAMRFAGGTAFPSMMALGSADDLSATYSVARAIAREMSAVGIRWNFAPVADINTNPDNPIINIRAFGEDADLVARHVDAYVRGLQDEGVAACAKHFPGHGDTRVDSHNEIPVVDADRDRLDRVELRPFASAVAAGVRSVMVSHIAVPAVDGAMVPASLSREITTGLLRDHLGFDGLVVTDALDMHAISRHHGAGDAAVLSFLAGSDVLLMPEDPRAALSALADAVDSGRISEQRVDRSFQRIEALTEWIAGQPSPDGDFESIRSGHDVIALESARRAVRASGSLPRLIPPLFVLAFVDTEENPAAEEWFTYFSTWYEGEAAGAVVTPEVSEADMSELLAAVAASSTVVAVVSVGPRGFAGQVGLSGDQQRIARAAAARSLVVIDLGNPYLLRDLEPRVRVDTYSSSSASLAVSIEALAGRIGIASASNVKQ